VTTRLSGSANLDPVRNARYLACVLRQAGLFTGVYLLIETVLWLYLLVSRADGTTLGPAIRLEIDSLWRVALVLAILFFLIPVPALLTEWSLLMEQSSDAAQMAFEQINSAFGTHGVPLDSQRVRTVSRHGEDDREYLELRRGHFRGYISCFVHGTDLYIGWTFWLYMSPLRLLMMVIGRNIRDATSQRKAIQRSLRFESARALMAAIHGATLAGIDAASDQLDPARACPVDHGSGWRSQIRIEATSMVPRQTKSRLSYLVATARCWRSWPKARSTVLRCLYAAASKAGGRPPLLPRRSRLRIWSEGSGIVALIPRLRTWARIAALE
jgi:hypothetical protein